MVRKQSSRGPFAATLFTSGAPPTLSPIRGTLTAPRAAEDGRLGEPTCSRRPADCTTCLHQHLPRTMTLPLVGTMRHLPRNHPQPCYLSAVRVFSWQTQPGRPTMMPGKSSLTGTCTGHRSTTGKPTLGSRSGLAFAATQRSTPLTLCFRHFRQTRTHVPDPWPSPPRVGFARGQPPKVLPCPGERIPVPAPPAAAVAAPRAPPAEAQGPPSSLAAVGPTHSWLFVPLLHAAVGRLTADAGQHWASHTSLGTVWRRSLGALQAADPVPPLSVVHVLHVLQQLASQEGRPVPVREAQLLLSLTSAASVLPAPTLVHLPWAWGQVVQPDGYIPATAQKALLHVSLGESAAAALVQAAARAPSGDPVAPAGIGHADGPDDGRDPSFSSSSSSSGTRNSSSTTTSCSNPPFPVPDAAPTLRDSPHFVSSSPSHSPRGVQHSVGIAAPTGQSGHSRAASPVSPPTAPPPPSTDNSPPSADLLRSAFASSLGQSRPFCGHGPCGATLRLVADASPFL